MFKTVQKFCLTKIIFIIGVTTVLITFRRNVSEICTILMAENVEDDLVVKPQQLIGGINGTQELIVCPTPAKNATDVLQVVNFTGLLQLVKLIKLQQVC